MLLNRRSRFFNSLFVPVGAAGQMQHETHSSLRIQVGPIPLTVTVSEYGHLVRVHQSFAVSVT